MSENTGRSVQANMLFNTVGSVIYYFCIWLSSVLIVRMSGYTDAGIFSVAMTVTASPAIFGLFHVRNYQVSENILTAPISEAESIPTSSL